jgi:hypothetical protein
LYGQYFILPVLLIGIVMVVLEYTHPEEHHYGHNPSPYAHIRAKPLPWKNDCSFFDKECHKAAKAKAKGEAVESHGHH